MKSIFNGIDGLIHEALLFGPKQSLKQKTACAKLLTTDEIIQNIKPLVFEMYAQIERNWSGRVPSNSNWKLRRPTNLNPNNRSPEVLLERAIVILSERGFIDGWYNQIPIASGLLDEVSDKRAAVDWVHMSDDCLELVELKWASDTPLYAIFEILRYGLAYLFCYKNKQAFGFQDLPTMNVSQLKLTTLAPREYYSYCNLKLLYSAIHSAINSLYMEKSDGFLSCHFTCSSFPIDFALPFETGADVLTLRDLSVDNPSVGILMNAMNNQIPAWENC